MTAPSAVAKLRTMPPQPDPSNAMTNEWTDYEPGQAVVPAMARSTPPAAPEPDLSEPTQLPNA